MDFLKKFLRSTYAPLIIISAIMLLITVPFLGRDQLADWDECIYAQYSKVMKSNHDLLTNHWNGKAMLEKPTLYPVMQQIPLMFGVNEFTLRILSVILGIALLGAMYHFCLRYFSKRVAIMAILVLLTTDLFNYYLIRVNTDFGFILFIFLGFYAWQLSYKKPALGLLSGLFFGLALLSKGPGVVAFLIAIGIYTLVYFNKQAIKNICGIFLGFLITIFPWHAYQYITHGQKFIDVYIFDNIIKRSQNPIEFHFEGRLFYIKLLFKEFFPWFIAPIMWIGLQLNVLKKKQIVVAIILCIVVMLIMITKVRTRIAWYSLPLFPFISILTAYSIDGLMTKLFKKETAKYIYITTVLILSFIAIKQLVTFSRFPESKPSTNPRNNVMIQSRKYPQKNLEYLVQYSERRARETLAPNLYTSITWIWGGNPCAPYYSEKHINYYYSIDDFTKNLNKKGELYILENGDLWILKDLKTKKLYNNTDFTLFTF